MDVRCRSVELNCRLVKRRCSGKGGRLYDTERNNCTGLRVERSGVEVVYYICNRLDCAIPKKLSQLKVLAFNTSALRETNILKFPPTKNWRPMIAIEI